MNRSETTGLRKHIICEQIMWTLQSVWKFVPPPPPNKNVRECQRHQPSRIGDSLRWRSCASCRATSNELAMCKLRMIFSGKGCNLVFRIFKSCKISLFWSYIYTYIYSCIFLNNFGVAYSSVPKSLDGWHEYTRVSTRSQVHRFSIDWKVAKQVYNTCVHYGLQCKWSSYPEERLWFAEAGSHGHTDCINCSTTVSFMSLICDLVCIAYHWW